MEVSCGDIDRYVANEIMGLSWGELGSHSLPLPLFLTAMALFKAAASANIKLFLDILKGDKLMRDPSADPWMLAVMTEDTDFLLGLLKVQPNFLEMHSRHSRHSIMTLPFDLDQMRAFLRVTTKSMSTLCHLVRWRMTEKGAEVDNRIFCELLTMFYDLHIEGPLVVSVLLHCRPEDVHHILFSLPKIKIVLKGSPMLVEKLFVTSPSPDMFEALVGFFRPRRLFYPHLCQADPMAVAKLCSVGEVTMSDLPLEVVKIYHVKDLRLPFRLTNEVTKAQAVALLTIAASYALPCLARSNMSDGAKVVFYQALNHYIMLPAECRTKSVFTLTKYLRFETEFKPHASVMDAEALLQVARCGLTHISVLDLLATKAEALVAHLNDFSGWDDRLKPEYNLTEAFLKRMELRRRFVISFQGRSVDTKAQAPKKRKMTNA